MGADNTTDSSVMSDARSQISVSFGHNVSAIHLVAAIASSEKAQPTTGAMVSLEVPVLGISIQWPIHSHWGAVQKS